jgi:hypothetical protein
VKQADIFTSAGNAVPLQQLKNSDPTKQVKKGRDVYYYLIPVGTKQTVAMYGDVMSNQHM